MAHGDHIVKEERDSTYKDLPGERPLSSSLYEVLLRRRWFIFSCSALCCIISAVFALLIPSQYESVAQVMPPNKGGNEALMSAAGERAASLVGLPADLLGGQSPGSLFLKIMTSETAENALIQQYDLLRVYHEKYWEIARKKLEENTTVMEDRKSGVITLRVRDKSRSRAQAMCQAYVNELNRLSTQLSTSSARRERKFLEGRLKVVKKELDESAQSLGQFSSKNSALDISQQGKATVEAATTLQGQLVTTEAELDGLKKIYGEGNVRVESAEARVNELRRSMRLLSGQGSEAAVQPDLPYPSIRKLPLLGVTYSDLLMQTELDASVYEELTKEYEMAKVQEAKDIPTVRLLDPPSFPEKHSFPPRIEMIVAGGVLGFILAVAWISWTTLRPEDLKSGPLVETYRAFRADLIRTTTYFRSREKRL